MYTYNSVSYGSDNKHDAVGNDVQEQTSVELEFPFEWRQVGDVPSLRRQISLPKWCHDFDWP